MIAVIDVTVQAENPALKLFPMRAFKGSPSSVRVRNVPRKIGTWSISKVYFSATYPDNQMACAECVLVGGVWIGTITGSARTGFSENGYSVTADGTDENGNAVTGYILGKGDITILDADGAITPGEVMHSMQLLSAESTNPKDGDVWKENGSYYIYQDGQAWPIGDDSELVNQLSAAIQTKADISALGAYAEKSELSDGSFTVKKADGSTSSEKLVNSLSDEHSTRIFIDEHDNVIVQKYVQSGWYVENVKVRIGITGDFADTTDYWVKVNVETTTDGLVFNCTMQDYARTLKTKHRSYTNSDTSITALTFLDSWMASETGGQAIFLEMLFAYSATPIWVNVSRLVPDGSLQSGLKASQIAADGTFVTPSQIEPLGYMHYAKGARDTLYMFQPNQLGTGQNKNKWVQIHPTEGKFIMVDSAYPSWFLSKYNGTTIDPPIEMKWGYHTTTTYYNRRITTIPLNSWGWVATSLYPQTGNTRNRFYIKATADDDGWIESIEDKLYVSTTAHDITFSSDGKSIETFDGSADLVECTRTGTQRVQTAQYYAVLADLESGLSAKADISALDAYAEKSELSTKQDALTDAQLSAVNSGITSGKVAQIGDWKYPFSAAQIIDQEPEWSYTFDPDVYAVTSEPMYDIDLGWWMTLYPIENPEDVFTVHNSTAPADATEITFTEAEGNPIEFTATVKYIKALIVTAFKNNTVYAPVGNYTMRLAVINDAQQGLNARQNDFWLGIDGTALSADLPFVLGVYPFEFHPRTSRDADFIVGAGTYNLYMFSEYRSGHFMVSRWAETEGGAA